MIVIVIQRRKINSENKSQKTQRKKKGIILMIT